MNDFMFSAIVVDDDEESLELFCEVLQSFDVDVLGQGRNGLDAVNLYKKFKPDIVFLDMIMPDYDGKYAVVNIRQIKPDSKIVVVTADLSLEQGQTLESLDVNVIYKPFELDKVRELLDELGLN